MSSIVATPGCTRRPQCRTGRVGGTVGVDLGGKYLAVLSTGRAVANPKHLEAVQRKLRRLQCRTGG